MSNSLLGLKVIVIGAGPGGLTFAKGACANGAEVEIIEQAGDPRGDNPGYTDRSFNLTLNSVGRKVLGDERAWHGSTDLIGRAIHNLDKEVNYASYGEGDSAILTSVPRPVLRQNLVSLVEEVGVRLRFNARVSDIDPDKGNVSVEMRDGSSKLLEADLIVVADGVHSLGDKFVELSMKGSLNIRVEPLNYLSIMLDKNACRDMSMHHIHFWHEPDSEAVAIGLPNANGTIAALLISRFEDVPQELSPFATDDQALARLRRDFPQLLNIEPGLTTQVLGKMRGRFFYKSISNYILGKKCVMVGDAGSASPPWAGFGANTAIYSADALVRFMIGMDLDQALVHYEKHKQILAKLVLEYANEHGEFLNKLVTKNPEQRPIGPVLGQLVNEATQKTEVPNTVQLLSF